MAQKDQQPTKKEHWLPQASHLEQFADDSGVLNAYILKDGQKNFVDTAKLIKTSPSGIGFKNDLYERPDLPKNTVENQLAKIEARFGVVLEEKIKTYQDITPSEHKIIAEYVGLLQHRTLRQRDYLLGKMDELDTMSKQIALAHNAPHASDKLSKEIEQAKQVVFTDTLAIAQEIEAWEKLDFCFLVVDKEIFSGMEFITGDHPVSLFDFTKSNTFYPPHPWDKTAENVVPLTSEIALFGNGVGFTGYKKLDANYIREVNFRTLSSSRRMALSRSEVTKEECNAIVNRLPQSMLLKFLNLPRGRTDKLLDKIKKDEKKSMKRR